MFYTINVSSYRYIKELIILMDNFFSDNELKISERKLYNSLSKISCIWELILKGSLFFFCRQEKLQNLVNLDVTHLFNLSSFIVKNSEMATIVLN